MTEKIMLIFLRSVKFVARLLHYDIFCATEGNGVGYVSYSNSGSEVIRKFVDEAAQLKAE